MIALVAVGVLALAAMALQAGPAQAAKAPQVTLKASAHTVLTTGRFSVLATTAHPVSGTKVLLQRQTATGWHKAGTFPHHRGGRLFWSKPARGTLHLRAELLRGGQVLDVSPVVTVRVTAPVKHTTTTSTGHSCTRTSTGGCIRGGEFCAQAMYGHTGYDASGRSWECTGDSTHPHWE